jgi:hypothetical protein
MPTFGGLDVLQTFAEKKCSAREVSESNGNHWKNDAPTPIPMPTNSVGVFSLILLLNTDLHSVGTVKQY